MTRRAKMTLLGLAGLAFAALLALAPDGASTVALGLVWSPLWIIAGLVAWQKDEVD